MIYNLFNMIYNIYNVYIIYMIYIYIYLDLSRATCVQSQMHICVTCSESKLYKYTVSIRKVEN